MSLPFCGVAMGMMMTMCVSRGFTTFLHWFIDNFEKDTHTHRHNCKWLIDVFSSFNLESGIQIYFLLVSYLLSPHCPLARALLYITRLIRFECLFSPFSFSILTEHKHKGYQCLLMTW